MSKKSETADTEVLSLVERTQEILKRTVPQRKTVVVGQNRSTNAQINPDDLQGSFSNLGALMPPYDPEILLKVFDHSNALRPNVDAYQTNIDAFGYKLDPIVDLKDEGALEKVGDAMFLERLERTKDPETGILSSVQAPNDEEIRNRMAEINVLQRIEKARVERFLKFCVPGSSLTELRQQTRSDMEITGNAFWEVLRTNSNQIRQFSHLPVATMRLMPMEPKFIPVRVNQLVSLDRYEKEEEQRRFRKFVQIVMFNYVYFKEFGDPRVMSSRTGKYYESAEQFKAAEADVPEATEVVHFRVSSSTSTSYGVPRWIGSLLSVLGSRASEEVNFAFFDNKAIPPLAILVDGGRLAAGAVEKIEKHIHDRIRGRENFHKILIIEAEDAKGPTSALDKGKARVTLQPLTVQEDGHFQTYDERNIDKVGMSFRLPRMLRGDIRDFNRASAEAALEFAEMQVFQPERNRFDLLMERVFSDLGFRFWKFSSKGPVVKDPATLAKMVSDTKDFLMPDEARRILQDVFNVQFRDVNGPWTEQPVTLADSASAGGGDPLDPAQKSANRTMAQLRKLAEVMRMRADIEQKEHHAEKNVERVIEIEVSKEEIDKWVE